MVTTFESIDTNQYSIYSPPLFNIAVIIETLPLMIAHTFTANKKKKKETNKKQNCISIKNKNYLITK